MCFLCVLNACLMRTLCMLAWCVLCKLGACLCLVYVVCAWFMLGVFFAQARCILCSVSFSLFLMFVLFVCNALLVYMRLLSKSA